MLQKYLDNLQWRNATKKFDPAKKLSDKHINFLKEVLRLTPSSLGIQPWKFYFVSDPKIREQLLPISDDQSQVTDASQLIIIASRIGLNESDADEYLQLTAAVRGGSAESLARRRRRLIDFIKSKTPTELDQWCARQSYIALGFLLSACAQNGIDSCPMEGFNAEAVSELLGIKTDGFIARAYCAVGFRATDDSYAQLAKIRFPLEKVIREI